MAGRAGLGRPKGAKNKLTRTIKAAIEAALDEAGGVAYLVRMSEEQPAAFLQLVGKVLPLQIVGEGDGPLKIQIVRYAGRADDPDTE